MQSESYDDFIHMVARNGLEMGEGPRQVAMSVLVDTEIVGDKTTILYSAEPFVDDPVTQTRLWPKDVIMGARHRDVECTVPERSIYDLALLCLKQDIYQAMMEIENPTVGRGGQ